MFERILTTQNIDNTRKSQNNFFWLLYTNGVFDFLLRSENLSIVKDINLRNDDNDVNDDTVNSQSSNVLEDQSSSQEDFDISECTQVSKKRLKFDKSNFAYTLLKIIQDKHMDAISTLKPPIVINKIPLIMENDARELHMSIDPYELLRNKYEIHGRTATLKTECEMMAFLRNFLHENNFRNSRHVLDLTLKLKERLKYEYPRFYNNERKIFKLHFEKLESIA